MWENCLQITTRGVIVLLSLVWQYLLHKLLHISVPLLMRSIHWDTINILWNIINISYTNECVTYTNQANIGSFALQSRCLSATIWTPHLILYIRFAYLQMINKIFYLYKALDDGNLLLLVVYLLWLFEMILLIFHQQFSVKYANHGNMPNISCCIYQILLLQTVTSCPVTNRRRSQVKPVSRTTAFVSLGKKQNKLQFEYFYSVNVIYAAIQHILPEKVLKERMFLVL